MELSTLASGQSKATTQTITNLRQLLDYLGTHPDTTIQYYASEMILNVHSEASYLSSRNARSQSSGHLFLIWTPQDKHSIHLIGTIFTLCNMLEFVAASAAEAELGALFLNAKQLRIMRLILQEL